MNTLQNTVAENLKGGQKIAKPEHNFTLEQVPPQDGKSTQPYAGISSLGTDTLQSLS